MNLCRVSQSALDVHRLRLLRELDRRGTLAAVARALSYSPSAISQQLSLLEAEAGVPLLEPAGRGVRLTPLARILVTHTEAILERLEEAEADLRASATEVRGTLRVASFQSVLFALIPSVLTRLAQRHPGCGSRSPMPAGASVRGPARAPVRPGAWRGVPGRGPAAGHRRPHPVARERRALHRLAGQRAVRPRRRRRPADSGWPTWRVCPGSSTRRTPAPAGGRATPAGRQGSSRTSATRALTCCSRSCWPNGATPSRSYPALLLAAVPRPDARIQRLPGRPRRRLTTGVRAGASGQPAIRAFREALRHAVREASQREAAWRGVRVRAGSAPRCRLSAALSAAGDRGCRRGPSRCGRRAARGPRRGARRGSRSR